LPATRLTALWTRKLESICFAVPGGSAPVIESAVQGKIAEPQTNHPGETKNQAYENLLLIIAYCKLNTCGQLISHFPFIFDCSGQRSRLCSSIYF